MLGKGFVRVSVFILIILLSYYFLQTTFSAKSKHGPIISVKVRWVIDKRLPAPTAKQMDESLAIVKQLAQRKLGVSVQFLKLEPLAIENFFKLLEDKKKNDCSSYLIHIDKEKFIKDMLRFWDLGLVKHRVFTLETVAELNPELKKVHTRKEFAQIMYSYYLTKLEELKKTRVGNTFLINRQKLYFHSPACWQIVQNSKVNKDVVLLTNEALIDPPGYINIHIKGTTVIAGGYPSLVSSVTRFIPLKPIEEFQGKITGKECALFGALILHELGHSLFKLIPTFKKKDVGCVLYEGRYLKTMLERYNAMMSMPPCQTEKRKANK